MRTCGIEIEVEREYTAGIIDRGTLHEAGWESVGDGSLRGCNSFELRYSEPKEFADTRAMLNALYPALTESSGSWRAAVHVHVDAQRRYSMQDTAIALAASMVFDLGLFERYSPERVESNFCVPLAHKVSDVLHTLRFYVASDSRVRRAPPVYGKYSSVNLGRMYDLGTFEFRHMRTPETDDSVGSVARCLDTIYKFTSDCHTLVDAGKQSLTSEKEGIDARILWAVDYVSNTTGLSVDQEMLGIVLDAVSSYHMPSPVTGVVAAALHRSGMRSFRRRNEGDGTPMSERLRAIFAEPNGGWPRAITPDEDWNIEFPGELEEMINNLEGE